MKNIVFIFLFISLMGCGDNKTETVAVEAPEAGDLVELSAAQLQGLELSFTEVQEKNMQQLLKLNGFVNVLPQNRVSVSSALGGFLKSSKLIAGMYFRKGEVIAVMEDIQYIQLQQDYLTAKAQLQNAELEYQRQKELNSNKTSSDKVYQQAKLDYETLQISTHALAQKLRQIRINPNQVAPNTISSAVPIYAPFDGFVAEVLVNVGKYVNPSDVLFELVNPKDLYLSLKVFEKDWPKIKVGQSLEAFTNSEPDQRYAGKVMLTGKHMGEDGTLDIHAQVQQTVVKLIPGMYINAELAIPENKSMVLPEDCVLSYEGGKYVFEMLSATKFKLLPVETGNTRESLVEIIAAETLSGKKIVQQGAYTLLMTLKNTAEEE